MLPVSWAGETVAGHGGTSRRLEAVRDASGRRTGRAILGGQAVSRFRETGQR